jgi:putative mRNA 3-end processing factor
VLRARLGAIELQTLAYGDRLRIGEVVLSLHPAGHVLGSAQVRIEHRGRVWVVSGDYFASGAGDANPTCDAFEPVRCDCFVTESTFALPVYRWRAQVQVMREICTWWQGNAEAGHASLLLAYSFGKAQRVLAGVDPSIGPIVVHEAVEPLNRAYRDAGVPLTRTRPIEALDRSARRRALVIAPPSAQGGAWLRRLGEHRDAFASGWMQLRGARRRQGLDRGFVLSDHADWPGLQQAIRATGAERVIVTHGYEAVLVRWLREQGLQADSLRTEYGSEDAPSSEEAGRRGGRDRT